MEWMAEVEIDDSIRGVADRLSGWKEKVAPARCSILFVCSTRHQRVGTEKLAGDACVPLSGIYEYTFVNGLCQVLLTDSMFDDSECFFVLLFGPTGR